MIEEPQKLEDSEKLETKEINKNEDSQKTEEIKDDKEVKNVEELSKEKKEEPIKNNEEENTKTIVYIQTINPNIFTNQELVKQFICPLCKGVLYDPIVPCKPDFKVYCKRCIDKYIEYKGNICPDCKNHFEENPKTFDIVKASISCLDTFCKNSKSGCKWKGQYAFYDKHLEECLKEETHCIFKGCEKIFLRENLDSHLKLCPFRIIKCEKCEMNIIASELLKHRDECPKEIIKCPQKCELKFERCKFKEHKEKCPFTLIKCPFEKIGCNEVIKRNEFLKKMKDNLPKHLNLFLNDYLSYKEKFENICKQHGIIFEEPKGEEVKDEGEEKENLQKKDKVFDKDAENSQKLNNDSNKKHKENQNDEICIKIEEIKPKKSSFVEEEKNEEKFVPIPKNILKNVISINFSQSQISHESDKINQNEKKEEKKDTQILIKDSSETKDINLLNKKRERTEEIQKNEINGNEINDDSKYNDNTEVQNIYNSDEISKKFKINGNIIGSNCLEGNVHYFVFAHDSRKIKKNSTGDYIIRFEVLEDVNWLSFGLCDKTIVENNEFTFSGKFSNNGYFFISTNNVIWHCTDLKQRKRVVSPPTISKIGSKGNIIECRYTPSTCMLLFYVNTIFLAGLYDVKPMQSDYLIPCLVFLKNCSVKTSFEYPK